MSTTLGKGQERGGKGKPKKHGGQVGSLGRALANQQRAVQRSHILVAGAEEGMETERGKGKMRSVTESNDLEDFMARASLANTDFTAVERAHAVVLQSTVVDRDTRARPQARLDLSVPRRPSWGAHTTPEELTQLENAAFLSWRRELAELEVLRARARVPCPWRAPRLAGLHPPAPLTLPILSPPPHLRSGAFRARAAARPRRAQESGALLTPFERNLEVWRQLWRVIERSDLVVQIVDARNPAAFRCVDLERYIAVAKYGPAGPPEMPEEAPGTEASVTGRKHLLLLNKADLVPWFVRRRWADHLAASGVEFAFFSARAANEEFTVAAAPGATALPPAAAPVAVEAAAPAAAGGHHGDVVLGRDALLDLLRSRCPQRRGESSTHRWTVGFVGYPNVGKSSTINALCSSKRVSVSATPGKTKHFQTLACPDEPLLCICDCPGLVFPNLAGSKGQMYCDGVLPVDQMRDHSDAIVELCARVPRTELERTYKIRLARRLPGVDPLPVTRARELLLAHGIVHAFLNKGGQPDEAKSARLIIKDLINGRLPHWELPDPAPRIGGDQGLGSASEGDVEEDVDGEDADEDEDEGLAKLTIASYLNDAAFDSQEAVTAQVRSDPVGPSTGQRARGKKAVQRRAEARAVGSGGLGGSLGHRVPDRLVAKGPPTS